MPVRCLRTAACAAALAVTVMAATVVAASPAHAAPKLWNGRYSMVTYASQKAGTSAANRQHETDFSAVFTMSTGCGSGVCVATADGPGSSNPTVPSPQRFSWDGQQWKAVYDWVWQCSVGGADQSQWSPARSFTFYTPSPTVHCAACGTPISPPDTVGAAW